MQKLRSLSLAALLVASAAASAQITLLGGGGFVQQAGAFSGTGTAITSSNPAISLSASQLRMVRKGDLTIALARTAQSGFFRETSVLDFRVDDFPILMASLVTDDNARFVVSGGNGSIPRARIQRDFRITETVGSGPAANDPVVYASGTSTSQIGNGLLDIDATHKDNADYLLTGKGTRYRMQLSFEIDWDTIGFTSSTPTIGLANEFGGPHAPGFRGYAFEMNYKPVPEPATIAVLAGGVFVGLRRRRR